MDNKYIKQNQLNQQDDAFKISEFFTFIWGLRYWIILFGIAALAVSYVYVKMQVPVYERKSQIMLVDERTSGSSEMAVLRDITGYQQSTPIDNEAFILRSPSLMTQVVNELGLNYRYYSYTVPRNVLKSDWAKKVLDFREYQFYNDAPFEMVLDFDELYPESERPSSISFEFRVANDSTFEVVEFCEYRDKEIRLDKNIPDAKRKIDFGTSVVCNGYNLKIVRKEGALLKKGIRYKATWSTPYLVGTSIAKNLNVAVEQGVQGKMFKTNVITMTLHDSKIGRADDILNMITVKYMEEARAFKNKSILATIEFIDKRLETISYELGNVESRYRSYQQSNTLVNIEAQSQLTLTSDMEYENQLTEIGLQQQILSMIKDNLDSMEPGKYAVIPSNIGLSDAGLNEVINNYNILVAERNRLVANSSENNPRVRNLNLQLADGRNSIVLSIDNLEKVYRIRSGEIKKVLNRSKSKMSYIPTQQFDLAQIERKQQIIEPLYLLLQQKREEAQISMYAVSDNVRVIEAAYGSSVPISPKNMQVYLLALILGCCIPPLFLFVKNYLRVTIQTKEDVERKLNVPILATLPKSSTAKEVISMNARDVKSESFRMLRSNLKFLSGKMIQVTSSTPGEGKSFVATNLALSLSHVGAKVLLVGLDLRKPALQFNLPKIKMDKDNSVVGYLIGKCQTPADSILNAQNEYGIDVAFSGFVPPNPTELLSTDKLQQLLDYYRAHYDYIVIDSAPMMPVADSILINKFIDITLYVIRSEVTTFKMLSEIAKLFQEREIKSPNLVLNCVDLQSDRLRYGYGYGNYGYGYGSYGYGYGYDSRKGRHHKA